VSQVSFIGSFGDAEPAPGSVRSRNAEDPFSSTDHTNNCRPNGWPDAIVRVLSDW
jgi:hypothetical protein